ncbi:MAG: hypothetical protein JJE27_00685 [Thermoleophilia bacterium]|nr:hypothetical protein [Thermoleophilia bacterium]
MNTNLRGWAKVGGMGALGLVVAAVLAALSLQLVSQPVGLSSEPLTAGNQLAPPAPAKEREQTTSPTSVATGSTTSTGASQPAGNDADSLRSDGAKPGGGHDGGGHEDD